MLSEAACPNSSGKSCLFLSLYFPYVPYVPYFPYFPYLPYLPYFPYEPYALYHFPQLKYLIHMFVIQFILLY